MATIRVRSTDGDNADNGSTWALAKADLHTATTGALAVASSPGDEIYVSQAHAQSTAASITLAALGTAENPTRIIGSNDSSDNPTAEATGGRISTTGTSPIALTGFATYKKVDIYAGSSNGNASLSLVSGTAPMATDISDCTLRLNNSSTNSRFNVGLGASTSDDDVSCIMRNCIVRFGSTSQRIVMGHGRFRWFGGSFDGNGTIPTSLFTQNGGTSIDALVEIVDLSAINTALVTASNACTGKIIFRNCKLYTGVSVITGTIPGPGGLEIYLFNSDSADTHSRHEKYMYGGSVLIDTATYLTAMNGDSSSSPVKSSLKFIALTTGASKAFPLTNENMEMVQWNETVGSSVTLTVEILHDSVTALTNDDIWIEVVYMGTSGNPLGVIATSKKSDYFATATNLSDGVGAGSWTHAMSNPNSQKMSVSFTPQEKGYIAVRVMQAAVNKTVYVGRPYTVA